MKSNARLNGFPEEWQDPLELYECMVDDLVNAGYNLDRERENLVELVNRYGAEWVWEHRQRLLELSRYFNDYVMRAVDVPR